MTGFAELVDLFMSRDGLNQDEAEALAWDKIQQEQLDETQGCPCGGDCECVDGHEVTW